MHQFLGEQPDADIWALYGRYITDLDSLCHQLERIVPVGRLDRRVEGRHGVLSALRSRGSTNQMGFSRARYLVWNDAQTLLRADRVLFSELIDAIAGVAAEWEYAGEDMLVIQRMMLVGGPDLADYAHDPRGQFNAWLGDEQSEPFWQTVTGLERPPFEVARIEELMA